MTQEWEALPDLDSTCRGPLDASCAWGVHTWEGGGDESHQPLLHTGQVLLWFWKGLMAKEMLCSR